MKDGNPQQEYEDAFDIDIESGRFAVSDGAESTSFSKEWARLLTAAFVAGQDVMTGVRSPTRLEGRFRQWLAPLQKKWYEGIKWESLPYYAEEKARFGAFATFLGFEIHRSVNMNGRCRWQAVAIGDSALFQIRNDDLKVAFPLSDPREFSNRSALVSSNPRRNAVALAGIGVKWGIAHPDDVFIVCTDALAKWFLLQCQSGLKPWSLICRLRNQGEFAGLVGELRCNRLVENDDMTVLIVDP